MNRYLNQRSLFIRASFLGAGWLGFACSNILGISEPMPLEVSAGASNGGTGGDVATFAGTAGGGDASSEGGAAGDLSIAAGGEPPSESGAGWQGGEEPKGGAGVGGDAGGSGCAAPATQCSGNELQRCEDGVWVHDQDCAAYCLGGACVNPPSCGQLVARPCGDTVSCCQGLEVPGGSFLRDYDGKNNLSPYYSATVSSFVMDRFEVTVGRFIAFFNVYDQVTRHQGDGKSAHVQGDVGWQDTYPMPKDHDELSAQLDCSDTTWDDQQNGDINLPVNCVNFYVAYAFCIWDQGRLPTEAEWNYAAAGGDQQREYPWSVATDAGLDLDHAYYGQEMGLPIDVGMKPKGNGRWGHSDLSGNVSEWTLDYFTQVYPSTICNDCLNSTVQPTRAVRGGGFRFNEAAQRVDSRTSNQPDQGGYYSGFRCVHDLPTSP